MHELSIAQNLISLVEEELARTGHIGQVISLTIKVGRLSGAHPDAINFAFEVISPNSRIRGSRLNIVETKAQSTCRYCGKSTEIDYIVIECPLCGSDDIEVSGGDELFLESIEIDESELYR